MSQACGVPLADECEGSTRCLVFWGILFDSIAWELCLLEVEWFHTVSMDRQGGGTGEIVIYSKDYYVHCKMRRVVLTRLWSPQLHLSASLVIKE